MLYILPLTTPFEMFEKSQATPAEQILIDKVSKVFFKIVDQLADAEFFIHPYETFFENFDSLIKERDRLILVISPTITDLIHYHITKEGLIRIVLPKNLDKIYKDNEYILILRILYIGVMCARLLKMPKQNLIESSLEQYQKNSSAAIKCLQELIDSLILNGLIDLAKEDTNKLVSDILQIETQEL